MPSSAVKMDLIAITASTKGRFMRFLRVPISFQLLIINQEMEETFKMPDSVRYTQKFQ